MMVSFPVDVPQDHPFPVQNLPFGIFSTPSGPKRAGVAIGNYVIDLAFLEANGIISPGVDLHQTAVFAEGSLASFASLPRVARQGTREKLKSLLLKEDSPLFKDANINQNAFLKSQDVQMHLPMTIPEFTDFSTAEEHVGNCFAMSGMSFNSENNFYYSPMAYTARCSSVVPSPTPIVRPNGMYKSSGDSLPQFQPTRKLDYELELAFFISNPVPSGTIVSPESAEEHIFGYVLMNDWSARDIQMYESLPVGPLNCKAFGTTISPWVVMPEALAHARTEPRNQRARKDQIPAHLKQDNLSQSTYEITCHAFLQRSGSEVAKPVSTSSTAHMFWSPGQLLAHRASTGCGLLTGELIGLGTVSSPEELWPDKSLERRGCLFEITNDGKEDVNINDIGGRWLEDGDIVVLEAWAPGDDGVKIGFGKVSGRVLPETSSSMLKTTNKNGTHI